MRANPILISVFAAAVVALAAGPAAADPDKDESGHGRGYKYEEKKYEGGEYKYESYDGNCKVEEKSGAGGYKKEVKCDHGGYGAGGGFDQTAGPAFERVEPGNTIVWRDPNSGTESRMTPTRDYTDPSGRYCREYQAVSVVNGQQQQTYGTACRQPDGTWQIVQ